MPLPRLLALAAILSALSVVSTPGHTSGHQCVVVRGSAGSGDDLLIGDAAYTPRQYADPSGPLPEGQASDVGAWRDSVHRIRALSPERVHFCHHTDIVHR